MYENYCTLLLNRRHPSPITKVHMMTLTGAIDIKVWREDGSEEILNDFRSYWLNTEEWDEIRALAANRKTKRWEEVFRRMRTSEQRMRQMGEILKLKPELSLEDQDPILELNELAKSKLPQEINIFPTSKKYTSFVQWNGHFPGTVLEFPKLGMVMFNHDQRKDFMSVDDLKDLNNQLLQNVMFTFYRMHRGPGLTEAARTFCLCLVTEADRRNAEKEGVQMKILKSLRAETQ